MQLPHEVDTVVRSGDPSSRTDFVPQTLGGIGSKPSSLHPFSWALLERITVSKTLPFRDSPYQQRIDAGTQKLGYLDQAWNNSEGLLSNQGLCGGTVLGSALQLKLHLCSYLLLSTSFHTC